eukprot:TRINITY_DN1091_c0_g1_i1.p1 TRINITY_DN1091_c0_g1~~TRINITY_DN1091_c0_g1_i1.p1  ORF type:complete len:94 (+),score=26.50 TRINITY_DN1091_c0_g1_i1:42-284(+)
MISLLFQNLSINAANEELLHFSKSQVGMVLEVEALSSIATSVVVDVLATGVLLAKLGDVVHVAVDDDPAVGLGAVLGNLN